MIFRAVKASKASPALPIRAGAAGLILFLAQFGAAGADPGARPQGWGANLETEAEFAYRSVYERSLTGRKERKAISRKVNKPAPLTTSSVPDLPDRKDVATTEQEPAAEPVQKAPATSPPPAELPKLSETGDSVEERPAEILLMPLIGHPRSLADVLTTQVIDEGDSAAGRPNRIPRGRGDQYCTNIANAANDARFVWQKQKLLETEEEVKKHIQELEAKIAEYRKWLNRRDEFSKKAQAAVTDIYAKMRPDAAAQQLTVLDELTAAAVISKLNPRVASAVMAEMDAKRAARLTSILSASSKGPKGKPPAKAEAGGT